MLRGIPKGPRLCHTHWISFIYERCNHIGRRQVSNWILELLVIITTGDDDYIKNFNFEQSKELMDELNEFEGISPELTKNMQAELTQALRGSENILVVGTEGERTITIVIAPRAVVGSRGPALIPTTDKIRVVSMVSKEFVEKCALTCQNMEDQDEAQEKWDQLLKFFFDKTLELVDNSSAPTLEIPDFIPKDGI